VLLALPLLHWSCMNSGTSHLQGAKDESGYEILSKAQADELFSRIRSQNADIEIVQRFFLNKSFYLKSVQALTQGSRVACIALYSARGDSERLGILAIKLQEDALVETISGILWLTTGSPSFANEIEGPKLTSSSAMSLCGWWSCVIRGSGTNYQARYTYDNPYSPSRRVARLESFGFPLVYYWFRYCY
jgi:hypothetical protein